MFLFTLIATLIIVGFFMYNNGIFGRVFWAFAELLYNGIVKSINYIKSII